VKSRRDGMKIAQGKRGTSAALGGRQKQNALSLSWFGAPGCAPNQDKGRLGGGVAYPGRQSLRSLALGYCLAAPPGRRTGGFSITTYFRGGREPEKKNSRHSASTAAGPSKWPDRLAEFPWVGGQS